MSINTDTTMTTITLRELRSRLPSTIGTNTPGWKEVEKNRNPLVTYDDGQLRMAVYPSGFITAHSGRHHTVFRIEDCGEYDYRFCKKIPGDCTPHHFDADYFLDQRWELRVLMEAEDRLECRSSHYEFDHAARF